MIEILHQFVRYGVKGGAGTLANIGLMSILVELGGFRPEVAAIVSTCVLLSLGYVVMNRWVFSKQQSPRGLRAHLRRGASYYAVILSGKAVNYVLFVALLSIGVWYPAAWFVGAVTVFLGTFSANRWLWLEGTAA